MKYLLIVFSAVALSICGALILSPVEATVPAPWSPHTGVPPLALHGFERKQVRVGGESWDWEGQFDTLILDGALSVSWKHVPTGDLYTQDPIPLSYWPTAVCPKPTGGGVIVGGKRRNGNTVIEEIDIHPPALLAGGAAFSPARVARITTVFDRAVNGFDMVAVLDILSNDSNNILVSFFDSNNLYRIDLDSNDYQPLLLASPTVSQTGVMLVPELDVTNTEIGRAHHLTLGHTYHIHHRLVRDSVLFYDSNLDGDLDGHVVIATSADWKSNGFHSSLNFSQIFD